MKKRTYELESVMNIIYNEEPIPRENQGFVCADDMKQASEDEVIEIPEGKINYQSFFRQGNEEKIEKSLTLEPNNNKDV